MPTLKLGAVKEVSLTRTSSAPWETCEIVVFEVASEEVTGTLQQTSSTPWETCEIVVLKVAHAGATGNVGAAEEGESTGLARTSFAPWETCEIVAAFEVAPALTCTA